jgi:hypothetical protein
MTTTPAPTGIHVDRRRMTTGGALIGLGGLLGLTGAVIAGSALVAAARQWIHQLEQPPSEIARLRWQQAKAATSAGADAWRSVPAGQGGEQTGPRGR